MIYIFNPIKDSTIFENETSQNTGLDEILELSNGVNENSSNTTSRILIKFDTREELDNIVTSGLLSSTQTSSLTYKLKLFATEHSEIPLDFNIECYLVSQSWNMGTGRLNNSPINTTGVSWKYRTAAADNVQWLTSSFTAGSTGSYSGSIYGGGNWYTTPYTTFSFIYQTTDPIFNVTQLVSQSINNITSNDGFIIKLTESLERRDDLLKSLKFFSKDSHTIYPPQMWIMWDDSSYVTSSAQILVNSDSITVRFKNLDSEYKETDIVKFRLYSRPQYPTRDFTTSSLVIPNYILSSASYYAIEDIYTKERIIDFDTTYTKISCDNTGSYFNIYMDGLQTERMYKFLIKTNVGGITKILDDNYHFKVTR
jgi:hypothetical protein